MGFKLAICQAASSADVRTNVMKIRTIVRDHDADVYLFPELYLTSYGGREYSETEIDTALSELSEICTEKDAAIAVGTPSFENGILRNSLVFLTPGNTTRYDKLYLANFPPYDEGIFTAGRSPVTVEWKGMKIGLLVCYDVMFPEIHRYYATHGADIVLMSSASAEKSRNAMNTVLPARSLENTAFTAFCNNIGEGPAGTFFGGSALYSPLGETVGEAGETEDILLFNIDKEEIIRARKVRHHLEDLRNDIEWS